MSESSKISKKNQHIVKRKILNNEVNYFSKNMLNPELILIGHDSSTPELN